MRSLKAQSYNKLDCYTYKNIRIILIHVVILEAVLMQWDHALLALENCLAFPLPLISAVLAVAPTGLPLNVRLSGHYPVVEAVIP